MTDRELLELAGKAIGQDVYWLGDDVPAIAGRDWNPLTDDGDALRLAVSIGANIDIGTVDVQVETRYSGVSCETFRPKRPRSEAVRRAIVRAAASIGKDMP